MYKLIYTVVYTNVRDENESYEEFVLELPRKKDLLNIAIEFMCKQNGYKPLKIIDAKTEKTVYDKIDFFKVYCKRIKEEIDSEIEE